MTNHFANTAETNFSKHFIGKTGGGNWTMWHVGSGVGLLGGTFILASAIFLTIFQFLYGEQPHGVWLFAIVLPLWILGAHCLDKIDETKKARRIANEEYETRESTKN